MLKWLYYLGRTIFCFDYEALGKTWCFSICCLLSDCIWWKDFHLSYSLYSQWENLYHLARHMIYIPVWGICIILLVVWFIFSLGEFVSSCSSYDLYSCLGEFVSFSLGEFVSFFLSYDLYFRLGNLYHLLLERFLDTVLLWTLLRSCYYLHWVAHVLAKIWLNKNFRIIHTWILSYLRFS